MSENNETLSLEYLDLNTIDPKADTRPPIPPAVYTVKLTDITHEDYVTSANAKNPNQQSYKIKIKLVISEGDLAGRPIYTTIFGSKMTPIFLRKIMDSTGVAQTGDLFSWFEQLRQFQPDFKVQIKSGERGPDVNWFTCAVASIPA